MTTDAATLEQMLLQEGVLLRPVEGDSMIPLLDQTTDVVRLIVPPKELQCYDLPLYRRPNGALVLHRIIKVRRNDYITCGDNRTRYERVPKHWVVALAQGRYRGDEYLSFDDEAYLEGVRALCQKRARVPARLHAFWMRLFPPFAVMKREFPAIGRCCLLLPFCYAVRWWRALTGKRL